MRRPADLLALAAADGGAHAQFADVPTPKVRHQIAADALLLHRGAPPRRAGRGAAIAGVAREEHADARRRAGGVPERGGGAAGLRVPARAAHGRGPAALRHRPAGREPGGAAEGRRPDRPPARAAVRAAARLALDGVQAVPRPDGGGAAPRVPAAAARGARRGAPLPLLRPRRARAVGARRDLALQRLVHRVRAGARHRRRRVARRPVALRPRLPCAGRLVRALAAAAPTPPPPAARRRRRRRRRWCSARRKPTSGCRSPTTSPPTSSPRASRGRSRPPCSSRCGRRCAARRAGRRPPRSCSPRCRGRSATDALRSAS